MWLCKQYIRTDKWKLLASDRVKWKYSIHKRLKENKNQYFNKGSGVDNKMRGKMSLSIFIFIN